jgi:branched-chain amino acid transport system ATP-binding protein
MSGLLEVTGLKKSFGGNLAVDDLTFTVRAGERLAIIGPNGAGKSTCFNLIGGQVRPDSGSVHLAGKRLNGLKPGRRHALGLGRTFQIGAVFRSMTLCENITTVMAAAGRGASCQGDADALLSAVGLSNAGERLSAELAYGDVKRLELAMALAGRPRALLMDEPTAGMAPAEGQDLMRLVVRLAGEEGIALIFTEHDMDIVFDHAQRILVLDRGRLIAEGEPEAVRANPEVRRVYLGETY